MRDLQGRCIVVLTTPDPTVRKGYFRGAPERCAAFVADARDPSADRWRPSPDWAAFVNMTFTPSNWKSVRPTAESHLFGSWLERRVSRLWVIKDQPAWNQACATYASHLAADLILGVDGQIAFLAMGEGTLREPFYDTTQKLLIVSIGDQSKYFMRPWYDPGEETPPRGFGRFSMIKVRPLDRSAPSK